MLEFTSLDWRYSPPNLLVVIVVKALLLDLPLLPFSLGGTICWRTYNKQAEYHDSSDQKECLASLSPLAPSPAHGIQLRCTNFIPYTTMSHYHLPGLRREDPSDA